MKKILMTLMIMLMGIVSIQARDYVTRDSSILPATARRTLKNNFPKIQINHIKVDTGVFGAKDYDVVLDNGIEVDFDRSGNWKEVDTGHRGVPDGLLPPAIKNYLKSNYRNAKVVKIEKDRNSYDLKLDSGLELEFDRTGRFLRIDH